MKGLIKWLQGKKTYIAAVLAAALNAAILLGYINLTPEQLVAVESLMAALLGVTIRAGLAKN